MTTDEDNKRLKNELSEMKARHRLEIERITREKEQEMDEVHKRSVGSAQCPEIIIKRLIR